MRMQPGWMRIAWMGLICLGLSGSLRADQLTGQITDAMGIPIVGATVDANGGVSAVVTGPGGFFTLIASPGTYDVTITGPGNAYVPQCFPCVTIVGTVNFGVVVLQSGSLVSGTVLDDAGLPVVNANIDAFDPVSGNQIFTPNDGTNLLGNFAVILPVGSVDLLIKPPAGTLLVPLHFPGFTVTGPTQSLGNVTMPTGNLLSGTLVDAVSQAPLAGFDLNVADASTGQQLFLLNDFTDGAGHFAFVVPTGVFTFFIRPPAGDLHVAQRFPIVVNGALNLGILPVEPGVLLQGTILTPTGQPVVGADLDVEKQPGHFQLYTPHDSTDGNGAFSLVVPTGNLIVIVQPAFSTGLVAARTATLTVTTSTVLAPWTLAAGQPLTGTVTNAFGQPEVGADIDVVDPATGLDIPSPDDNTDSNGQFHVNVPLGTWDVILRPSRFSIAKEQTMSAVAIAGPTTLNFTLTTVPTFVYLAASGGTLTRIPNGSPLPVDIAVYNPTPFVQGHMLRILLEDPFGVAAPLFPDLPLILTPQQFLFGLSFPLPLPPVSPTLTGLPFRVRFLVIDPLTNEVVDQADTRFIPE